MPGQVATEGGDMGTLFRLKRLLTRADSAASGQYECLTCHATFAYRQQVCPECGGYDIRSTEWLDETDEPRHPDDRL